MAIQFKPKIVPNLWFDSHAEEAANFYASTFENANVGAILRYDEASAQTSGQPVGSVLTVEFEVEGMKFVGLNGGPLFKLNPSISFHVKCETKEKVDNLWNKLSDGGEILIPLDSYPFSERYGWCNDKYGVSWQIIHVDDADIQQKIIPVLMFVGDVCGKAEEAANFYADVFENGEAHVFARYGADEAPDAEGTVKYASFTLEGQEFGAMDSAQPHQFAFNEANSFMVDCKDQEEVDYFWEKLTADGGQESMCGWLKDKYGVSWQIVPTALTEMVSDPDSEKAQSVVNAMLKMQKIDIGVLRQAYEQGSLNAA